MSVPSLVDQLDELAAGVVLRPEVEGSREVVLQSLLNLASTARGEGHERFATAAEQAAGALRQPNVDDSRLAAAIAAELEKLRQSIPGEPAAAPASSMNLAQDPELIADFVHESREHLESIETQLLAVEENRNPDEALHAIFRSFHTIKGLAGFLEFALIQEVAHEVETVLDRARQGLSRINTAAVDVILESRDYIGKWLRLLDGGPVAEAPADLTDTRGLLARIRRLHCQADEQAKVQDEADAPAPGAESETGVATSTDKKGKSGTRLVKVNTDKLDYLVDMVGEMVIAQSLVRHDPDISLLNNSRISRNLSQLARITEEVQRTAMAMRMVPIGPLFQKMARLVRDLARKSGKEIAFETEGENVELDRNIVEELADPLMHMIRNAADHGVEAPQDRVASGKPAKARVGLRAFHRSGQIVIEVSDDGRGLQRGKILDKARQKGLLDPQDVLTDGEVLSLIFHPGFSTAEKVSDLSGRGVGMDVVRKQIQRLRGSVDIKSEEGVGTTFELRLPLTLAIIDGLVVKVGSERYIIPLASVKEMLRPVADMVTTVENRAEVVSIRDRLLPVVRLYQRVGVHPRSTEPTECVLVVAEVDGLTFALMVDELIGKQEVVIKGLGPVFQRVAGIAGGAILGDGQIGLILDLKGIFGGRKGV